MIALTPTARGNGHPRPPTPGEVAQALTGRDYVSYSQISLFQSCPLKWHFTYVEKVQPESTSAALLVGSSIHAAIQHHLESQLASDKQPTVDELMAVFSKNWKDEAKEIPVDYSREENAESQAELGRRMLESFLASPYSKVEGHTLAIEETLRVSLHAELPDLVAKVDHISAVDHQLVVTDFKTCRSMWSRETAEEHAQQLHLYSEAVQTIAEDFQVLSAPPRKPSESADLKVRRVFGGRLACRDA
jgi:putative RecB family exonuclease